MKAKLNRTHISIQHNGFVILYLWWGIDGWTNTRCIEIAFGRPKHKLIWCWNLWKVKK